VAEKLIPAGTPNDGLPESFKPVESPPIVAGSAPSAAFVGASPYFAASIPLSSQLVPDIMPTRFPGGLGGYRIFPPGASGVAQNNAAAQSTITEQGGPTNIFLGSGTQQTQVPLVPSNCPCMSGGTVPISTNYTATGADNGKLLSFSTSVALALVDTVQSGGTTASPNPVTFSLPGTDTAEGDLMVVGIGSNNTGTIAVSGVTDDAGNAYLPGPTVGQQFFYYAENCVPNGSNGNEVHIALSTVIGQFAACCWRIQGAAKTLALDTSASGLTASPASTVTTGPFSTNFQSEISVAFISVTNVGGHTFTAGSGYTLDTFATVPFFGAGNNGAQHQIFSTIQSGITSSMGMSPSEPSYLLLANFRAGDGTITITLPNPPPFPKWTLYIQNTGTGLLIVNPSGLVIDGFSGSLTLGAGQGIGIFTDGSNYFTFSSGFVDPMTTAGDIIYENTVLQPARLPIGSDGQVLTVSGGLPAWETPFENPLTTKGDILYENATPAPARLPIGTTGQVLTVASGIPSWATPTAGFANPMTTEGDIIIENATPAPDRLAIGSSGQVLTVVSGLPAWAAGGGGGNSTNPTSRRWAYGVTSISALNVAASWVGDTGVTNGGVSAVAAATGSFPNLPVPNTAITSSSTATRATLSSGLLAAASGWTLVGKNMLFVARIALSTLTSIRCRIGVGATTAAGWLAADSLSSTKYASFRFSTSASDVNWQCETSDGTSVTTTDSGVAAVASSLVTLGIQFNDSIPNVVFSINGTVVVTQTTHLPGTGVPLGYCAGIIPLTNVSETIYIPWIYEESDN